MFSNTEGGPPNVGQTIIAMDPAFIGDGFVPHLETLFSALTEGNDVRIPGERRGADADHGCDDHRSEGRHQARRGRGELIETPPRGTGGAPARSPFHRWREGESGAAGRKPVPRGA